MASGLDSALDHLRTLIAFDTQNPPRDLRGDSPIFDYLSDAFGGAFGVEVTDHGGGSVSFHARRGEGRDTLFNVHLDTVPVLPGARFPALEMHVDRGRAYGRGACDIKGAAACLLAVAERTDAPMSVLFTTDEEGGEGCCVAEFIASGRATEYDQIVVAEPTGCRAEFRHRGFLSARGVFHGVGGHSSEARALQDNAIHRLASWCAVALEEAGEAERQGRRTCFNIGTVDGGVKSNVIADRAGVFWSARLRPGESNEEFMKSLKGLAGGEHADWEVSFSGPPLPTRGHDSEVAVAYARRHGLEAGDGLDFWTEASLFAAAGMPALVLGPGDIEQAHVVDEWVTLEQLERCVDLYTALVQARV